MWDAFRGERIYLDSNIVIYAFEGGTKWTPAFEQMITLINEGSLSAFTSELTLLEVIVKPLRLNNSAVVEAYERLLSPTSRIVTLPVDRAVLRLAALLRAELGLKLADAIHVATAQSLACDLFFSNDGRIAMPAGLKSLTPDGIQEQSA